MGRRMAPPQRARTGDGRSTGRGQGLGIWDRLHPGFRGALITMPFLLIIFVAALAARLPLSVAEAPLPILLCYGLSAAVQLGNGVIAATQARSTFSKSDRLVGRLHERTRVGKPNFMEAGLVAGAIIAAFYLILYITAFALISDPVGEAVINLLPASHLMAEILWIPMVLDIAASVGLAVLGALLYERIE